MSTTSIPAAYDMWPQYNRRLWEVIGAMAGRLSRVADPW